MHHRPSLRHTLPSLLAVALLAACGDASGGPDGGTGAPRADAGPGGSTTDSGPAAPRADSGPAADAGPAPLPSGCTAPLAAPRPNCRPAVPATTGDPAQDCVNRINQFRAECQCLPPLARWTEGEACANQQAMYDSTRTPHAGFSARICDGGRGQNECPGWGSVPQTISGCLQQMWDEGPGEPFSAHGHYINMTNSAHSRVACGFYTTPSGQVWAIQNFR